MFADMGAEVIKIEPVGAGDEMCTTACCSYKSRPALDESARAVIPLAPPLIGQTPVGWVFTSATPALVGQLPNRCLPVLFRLVRPTDRMGRRTLVRECCSGPLVLRRRASMPVHPPSESKVDFIIAACSP